MLDIKIKLNSGYKYRNIVEEDTFKIEILIDYFFEAKNFTPIYNLKRYIQIINHLRFVFYNKKVIQ